MKNERERLRTLSEAQKRAIVRSGSRLDSIGLPPDCDHRLPHITISGTGFLSIEHHCGVLQLTCGCIRLYTSLGVVRIDGSGLRASGMDEDAISVKGLIKSVSFE